MKAITNYIETVTNQLVGIENQNENFLEKSVPGAIALLEGAFETLKAMLSDYQFQNEVEEILFFKEMKPQLFCKLIYYKKIYNIETMRPNGSNCSQKAYLTCELDQLTLFFNRNIDFYKYYRSENTHLDRCYFLRGKPDIEMTLETFYFERDPMFSTAYDFKVAKVLANELLRIYLNAELQKLEVNTNMMPEPSGFPKTKETWTGSKTELVELIYALCETNCFNLGKITRKRLGNYFESVFNVDLGDIYHTYLELREKENRTQFLDELKKRLIKKMDEDDSKKK